METTTVNQVLIIWGVVILLFDAVLELDDNTTISRWYQRLFPRWVDWVIFVLGMIGLMMLPDWIYTETKIIWAGFWGHITIANKERYKS